MSIAPDTFFIVADEMPLEVPPNESIPVSIGYGSEEEGDMRAELVIATDNGCASFNSLVGLATSGSLITYSDRFIDMGSVARGELSEIRRIELLVQGQTSDGNLSHFGFAASPEEFKMISAPSEPLVLGSCERAFLDVQFAPSLEGALGAVDGAVGWETRIPTPEGEAYGLVHIPLLGNVTAE